MKRIIKASDESTAGLEVGEGAVRLSGDRTSFFYSDPSGVYLVGNVSILAEPQNIRIASNYVFPTAYKGQIPSTLASPQAIFIEDSPVEGFTELADSVTALLGELL
jgi:hypothetical protein